MKKAGSDLRTWLCRALLAALALVVLVRVVRGQQPGSAAAKPDVSGPAKLIAQIADRSHVLVLSEEDQYLLPMLAPVAGPSGEIDASQPAQDENGTPAENVEGAPAEPAAAGQQGLGESDEAPPGDDCADKDAPPACREDRDEGGPKLDLRALPLVFVQSCDSLEEGVGRSVFASGGVDPATGTTTRAVHHDRVVAAHPDTHVPLAGITVPAWTDVLTIAESLSRAVELGYISVDLVLDARRGPLVLEANARPGLAVQITNGAGLLGRCEVPQPRASAAARRRRYLRGRGRRPAPQPLAATTITSAPGNADARRSAGE